MESLKISKKELKRRAEIEEGYYFTGNVYSYETIVTYLSQLAWRTERGRKTENKKRIKEIKTELLKNVNKNYLNSLQDIVKNIESLKLLLKSLKFTLFFKDFCDVIFLVLHFV